MKRAELQRKTPLNRGTRLKQRRTFQASPEQRAKCREAPCVVCLSSPCDPAHLCSRAMGGCDQPACTVPLCRGHHRLFDAGQLDLQPHLVPYRAEEIAHALVHYRGDLISLLHRLTGERYVPERVAA